MLDEDAAHQEARRPQPEQGPASHTQLRSLDLAATNPQTRAALQNTTTQRAGNDNQPLTLRNLIEHPYDDTVTQRATTHPLTGTLEALAAMTVLVRTRDHIPASAHHLALAPSLPARTALLPATHPRVNPSDARALRSTLASWSNPQDDPILDPTCPAEAVLTPPDLLTAAIGVTAQPPGRARPAPSRWRNRHPRSPVHTADRRPHDNGPPERQARGKDEQHAARVD